MIRTTPTEVITCPYCHRPDWERRIEHALLTEEEQLVGYGHLLVETGLPADTERCFVSNCATIQRTIREAIKIAKVIKKDVSFEFNGEIVRISSVSDADAVFRSWWKAVYHETYEQSSARR